MVLRVGGLASGMDIESIVKNLMTAERMPLDKLKQQKQTLEWQRDDYRAMNTLLLDFRTELTQMKLTSKYRSSSVTTSNDALATATAAKSAAQSTYTISNVTALAKSENWVTAAIGSAGAVDASKAFNDASNTFAATSLGQVESETSIWRNGTASSKTLTGNGSTTGLDLGVTNIKTTDFANMSVKVDGVLYDVVSGPPGAGTDEVSISADGKLTFGTAVASGANVKVDYITNDTGKYANFSIGTKTSKGDVTVGFLVNSTDTMNQVVNKVNASEAGVSMFFDSATNKISLMQKETGDFNNGGGNITVSGAFATDLLKLDVNDPSVRKLGSDAIFTINGLSTSRKSNTFEMNGVSITLKKTSALNETASLSVSKDSNAIYDNIKGFVDKYNTLIGAISSKTSEERYRSYTPLTDDQREQLSDKQQEQWEEKAKSGLLRRDSILTGVLTTMRGNFSQPVSNDTTNAMYRQLASIGITTTANYLEGGKLEINEAKLKEAINTNPDAVEALFRGGGDSAAAGEKGIVHRLYDTVNATMDRLKERAGNTFSTSQQFALGRQLSNIDSSITRFESRLTQVEDRYWKQFTAMEKAIQQANSQSSYLMQQFSM